MEEHVLKCPACKEGVLTVLSDQVDIPHFGEVSVSTMVCPGCGYRSSDVIPLKRSSPMRYIFKIDGPEKMKVRVVRSGSSTVQIPQIGARIDPGRFSEGYITNVEGIFQRVLNILNQLLRDFTSSLGEEDLSDRIKMTNDLIGLLGSFIDGDINRNEPLTLILEDPYGNSAIIPDDDMDVVKEPLTDDEIAKMLEFQSDNDLIEED